MPADPAPAAPTDAALRWMAAQIVAADAQFAQAHDPLAAQHDADPVMLLRALYGEDEWRFAALQQARDGGWLRALTRALLRDAQAFPGIDRAGATGQRLSTELQAIVDPQAGFVDPGALNSGTLTAERRVCCIRVSAPAGESSGSGFLVGWQTVLTAWHVIAPLLNAQGRPLAGSAQKLLVQFDHLDGVRTVDLKVADDWLLGGSAPHPTEHPTEHALAFGPPVDGFDKALDCALILLGAPVGRERGYYVLDRQRRPRVDQPRARISVFQHPAGGRMRMAWGVATQLWPGEAGTRLRHTANTTAGSSGGLVLDADFEPVALHQCGHRDEAGNAIVNGAIPTANIAANLDRFDTVSGLDPLWRLPGGEPVFGRLDWQQQVMEAVTARKRILVVAGREPGSGRSFSLAILKAMLGHAEHLYVELAAGGLPSAPHALAAVVLERLQPEPMPTVDPAAPATPGQAAEAAAALPSPAQAETAAAAWVRDVLLPAFTQRLAAVAGKRTLWLVFDDMDAPGVDGLPWRLLLEQLCARIEQLPFLRLVLLGHPGLVPAAPPRWVAVDDRLAFGEDEVFESLSRHATAADKVFAGNELRRMAAVALKAAAQSTQPRARASAQAFAAIVLPALGLA